MLLLVLIVSYAHCEPPSWIIISGTEYSMVVIASISLFNEDFVGGDGNIAAAFGSGGEVDCRSIGLWQDANPPYWDGYWYFTVVGDASGEEISFKIYNDSSDSVYDCTPKFFFSINATFGSPYDPIEIFALYPPTDISITVSTITHIPTITWSSVEGANSYYIYSFDTPSSELSASTLTAHITGTSWSDTQHTKNFYAVTSSDDSLYSSKCLKNIKNDTVNKDNP